PHEAALQLLAWVCLWSFTTSWCELVLDYETTVPQFIGSNGAALKPDPLLAQQKLQEFLNIQRDRNATKPEIYKKVLLQTLQQHKHAHHQHVSLSQQHSGLPSSISSSNSLLKQYVDHTLSDHAVNRILDQLQNSKLRENYRSKNYTKDMNIKRKPRSSDKSGLMYIPLGGTKKVQCPTAADAAGISITQMAFLSICLTVFNIIVNISNNINNNNNNNNINSNNNLANSNVQLSSNVNNAAQINIMLPPPTPGKKKRSILRQLWETIHMPFKAKWKKCQRKRKIILNDKELDKSDENQDGNDICD
ncbi:unnamed protein product, partial [Meganyctiphanes norvegica]